MMTAIPAKLAEALRSVRIDELALLCDWETPDWAATPEMRRARREWERLMMEQYRCAARRGEGPLAGWA